MIQPIFLERFDKCNPQNKVAVETRILNNVINNNNYDKNYYAPRNSVFAHLSRKTGCCDFPGFRFTENGDVFQTQGFTAKETKILEQSKKIADWYSNFMQKVSKNKN